MIQVKVKESREVRIVEVHRNEWVENAGPRYV